MVAFIRKNHSNQFNWCCNKYFHYLDAVMYRLDLLPSGHQVCGTSNTTIEYDWFSPKVFYVDKEGYTSLVFDSGCTIAVTPHKKNFTVPITNNPLN